MTGMESHHSLSRLSPLLVVSSFFFRSFEVMKKPNNIDPIIMYFVGINASVIARQLNTAITMSACCNPTKKVGIVISMGNELK